MKIELPYANSSMDGAYALEVINVATGEVLKGVVEANAAEGWYDQIVTQGGRRVIDPLNPRRYLLRRVNAAVKILRTVDDPDLVDERMRRAEAKRARQVMRQAKGMIGSSIAA